MTEDLFRGHFIMTRATLAKLFAFCSRYIQAFEEGGGLKPMKVEEMVYITIWFHADQNVLRKSGMTFGRAHSTVWKAIIRVISLLEKQQHEFIKRPTKEVPLKAIAAEFHSRVGFPGVIGLIDSTQVTHDARSEKTQDCNNRKFCYKSTLALAISLPNRKVS